MDRNGWARVEFRIAARHIPSFWIFGSAARVFVHVQYTPASQPCYHFLLLLLPLLLLPLPHTLTALLLRHIHSLLLILLFCCNSYSNLTLHRSYERRQTSFTANTQSPPLNSVSRILRDANSKAVTRTRPDRQTRATIKGRHLPQREEKLHRCLLKLPSDIPIPAAASLSSHRDTSRATRWMRPMARCATYPRVPCV